VATIAKMTSEGIMFTNSVDNGLSQDLKYVTSNSNINSLYRADLLSLLNMSVE
jgi:hypothetical protein